MNPSHEQAVIGTTFSLSQTFSAYKTQGRTGIKVLFDSYVVYGVDRTAIYFAATSAMDGPNPIPGRQTYFMSPAKWSERVADGTILPG